MPPRRLALLIGALAAIAAAIYAPVLFGGRTFVERDHLVYTRPVRAVLHEALRDGRFPAWWSGVGFGAPFAANPVHQAFSPVAWLGAALPWPWGADVEPVLLVLVAGLGTALLSLRLGAGTPGAIVAGGLVEASGYLGTMVVNGNMPHVAWVPWIAWSVDRLASAEEDSGDGRRRHLRTAALAAVFGALQLTGAEPGATLTAALLALAVVLWRSPRPLRSVAWLLGVGAGAAALAAVVLIPALELARWSKRAGGLPLDEAALWSLHPLRLIELVWPRLLGDPLGVTSSLASVAADTGGGILSEPSWSFSVFIGAPAILLAVAGAGDRRSRGLLATALVFVLLALGTVTPLFPVLRAVFPPERWVRYPEKHVYGAILLVAAFAGAGLTRLWRARIRWLPASLASGGAALAAAAGLVHLASPRIAAWALARAGAQGMELHAAEALRMSVREGALAAAALAIAAAGVALVSRPRFDRLTASGNQPSDSPRSALRTRLGIALVAVATLAIPVRDETALLSLAPRSAERGMPDLLARAETIAPGARRIFRDLAPAPPGLSAEEYARWAHETLAGDVAARFGYQVIPGMNPTESAEHHAFFTGRYGVLDPPALAERLGIPLLVADQRMGAALPGSIVADRSGFVLAHVESVRPLAFVATAEVHAADAAAALASLAEPGPREPGLVAIEGPTVRDGRAPGPPAPCLVEPHSPERIEMICVTPHPSHAVLLDAWAPGWTATVDGAPAPVLRADGLFRAVPIDPGTHRIALAYRTPGLAAGAALSALAAAALAASFWLSRAKRHERAPAVAGISPTP